jgi:hypothetical protein
LRPVGGASVLATHRGNAARFGSRGGRGSQQLAEFIAQACARPSVSSQAQLAVPAVSAGVEGGAHSAGLPRQSRARRGLPRGLRDEPEEARLSLGLIRRGGGGPISPSSNCTPPRWDATFPFDHPFVCPLRFRLEDPPRDAHRMKLRIGRVHRRRPLAGGTRVAAFPPA